MENILFVCTLNLQRSPTAERVYQELIKRKGLSQNVKSAGIDSDAVKVISKDLIKWADKIYVMERWHKEFIVELDPSSEHKIKVLDIPDSYFRDEERLIKILEEKLNKEI